MLSGCLHIVAFVMTSTQLAHTQAYEFDIAVGIEFAHTDPMLCFYTAAFMNADHMAGCVSGCSVNITIG